MRRLDVIEDWIALARLSMYDTENLAKLCNISSSQLRRYFNDVFGRPPKEWLDELRLWHAMELLCKGLPVKEVSGSLGFCGTSHFCHKFKSYHGCTPKECVALYFHRLKRDRTYWLDEKSVPPWKAAECRLLGRIQRIQAYYSEN